MSGFFDWLGGQRSERRSRGDASALAAQPAPADPYAELSARLGDYPPDTPLHRGDPLKLTREQRAENLTQFVERNPERIATLVSWLWREGFDASLVMKGDETAFVEGRKIDAWLADWVPKRPFDRIKGDPEVNPPQARWFASDRAGADLVFSFILDLTRLNARAISNARPLFAWATVEDELDRAIRTDPENNPTDQSSSELGHLCLVRDLYDGSPPVVIDLPLIVLQLVHQRMSPLGLPVADQFPVYLKAILEGAYFWEEPEPRE